MLSGNQTEQAKPLKPGYNRKPLNKSKQLLKTRKSKKKKQLTKKQLKKTIIHIKESYFPVSSI